MALFPECPHPLEKNCWWQRWVTACSGLREEKAGREAHQLPDRARTAGCAGASLIRATLAMPSCPPRA